MNVLINLICLNTIDYGISSLFFDKFLGKRKENLNYYFFLALIICLASIGNTLVDVGALYLLISAILNVILSFAYEENLWTRLAKTGFLILLSPISTLISNLLLYKLPGLDMPYFLELILPLGLKFSIILIISSLYDKGHELDANIVSLILLGLILYFFNSTYNLLARGYLALYEYQVYAFLGLILLLFLFLLLKYRQDKKIKKLKLNLLEKEIQNRKDYYNSLTDKEMEIRKLSHDLKNRMVSILFSSDDIQKEIRTLIKDMEEKSATLSPSPVLNYLIDYKLKDFDILNKNLLININLKEDIKIPDADIGLILGNALDNAREALSHLKLEDRFLKIFISLDMGMVHISMQNTYNDKIDRRPKQNRGFGLNSIRKICQSYGGFLEIKENEYFCLDAYLFNKA